MAGAMRVLAFFSLVCVCAGAVWIDDPGLRKIAENRVTFTESQPIGNTTLPRYRLDLDLDPVDRYLQCFFKTLLAYVHGNRNATHPQVDSHSLTAVLSTTRSCCNPSKYFLGDGGRCKNC